MEESLNKLHMAKESSERKPYLDMGIVDKIA
jgi:hypothetical protein